MFPSLLNSSKLVSIAPGSLLAFVIFWAMRQSRRRRLSWTSIPKPPCGNHPLSHRFSPSTLHRVQLTVEQPTEGSTAFQEWMLTMSLQFSGNPWLLQRSGRPDVLVVSSPNAFEEIQRTLVAQFKSVECETEGLVHDVHGQANANVGTQHLRPSAKTQRRLATIVVTSPLLRQQTSKLVDQHLDSLLKTLVDMAETSAGGHALEVTTLMRQFATNVFFELGFGSQLETFGQARAVNQALDDIAKCIAERAMRAVMTRKLERLFNVGNEAALRRSVNVVKAVAFNAVKTTKRKGFTSIGKGSTNILDLVSSQKGMSKDAHHVAFLAQFVLNLVVAARDATAITLAKCLQCLAHHPEEQDKLVRELQHARERDDDLHSVARLEAVIKETLRLYPITPFLRRQAICNTILSDNTFIAKGTEVGLDLYTLARRNDVWGPTSGHFQPQRWIDRASGKLRPVSSYKFHAFSGGPRACVGTTIALNEMKVVLIAVVTSLHLEMYDQDNQADRDQIRVKVRKDK